MGNLGESFDTAWNLVKEEPDESTDAWDDVHYRGKDNCDSCGSYRDPNSDHSPLTAAVSRASHPGIKIFVRWLLDHGADRRVDAADEVNPLQIAKRSEDNSLVAMLR